MDIIERLDAAIKTEDFWVGDQREDNILKDSKKIIERLRNNQSILITSFRVNMMRLCPEYSHEEFDKDIAAMLKEKE
jgi:hypothetical protein